MSSQDIYYLNFSDFYSKLSNIECLVLPPSETQKIKIDYAVVKFSVNSLFGSVEGICKYLPIGK